MPNPRIHVFILYRDRTNYIKATVDSILGQDVNEAFQVTISDNSELHKNTINDYYPRSEVTYIRRFPTLSFHHHLNTLISECKSEYVVFFHDDDLMHRSYIRRMTEALDTNPLIGAVSCNAAILNGNKATKLNLMRNFRDPHLIEDVEALIYSYLSLSSRDPAPLPGYMYRSSVIKDCFLYKSEGGMHADVSFLMKVTSKAPILWIPDVLISYRVHRGSMSFHNEIGHKLSLLRFIYTNSKIHREDSVIDEFRYRYWLKYLLENGFKPREIKSHKYKTASKFIIKMSLKLLFSLSLWKRTFHYISYRFY